MGGLEMLHRTSPVFVTSFCIHLENTSCILKPKNKVAPIKNPFYYKGGKKNGFNNIIWGGGEPSKQKMRPDTISHLDWCGFSPTPAALGYLLFRQYWPSSPANGELGFLGTVWGGWEAALAYSIRNCNQDLRGQMANCYCAVCHVFCGSAVNEGKVADIGRPEWSFIHFWR